MVTWLWFATHSEHLIHLDPSHYKWVTSDGAPLAKPTWVCQSPDGGLHVDRRVHDQIDAHIQGEPDPNFELNAISGYGVPVIEVAWLERLNGAALGNCRVGDVLYLGRPLERWRTLWSTRRPCLRATQETIVKHCSICGATMCWPVSGKTFFDDSAIENDAVIATESGVFVRSDIAAQPSFRYPAGVFTPETVELLAK